MHFERFGILYFFAPPNKMSVNGGKGFKIFIKWNVNKCLIEKYRWKCNRILMIKTLFH